MARPCIAMSIRTDAGICRYCGVVTVVTNLTKIEGEAGYDAYHCPECKEGRTTMQKDQGVKR